MTGDDDGRRLQELSSRWSSRWRVWRSRDEFGRPKSWCATYRREGNELGQTLMEPSAEALEVALWEATVSPRPELEPWAGDVFVGGRLAFSVAVDPAGRPVFEYLYVTVAKRILRGMHAIGLKPGQRLPPIADLAAAFAVSPDTVRHAVKLLEERDLTVVRKGRGVFAGERVADLTTAAVGGGSGHLSDLLAFGIAVEAKPRGSAGEQ